MIKNISFLCFVIFFILFFILQIYFLYHFSIISSIVLLVICQIISFVILIIVFNKGFAELKKESRESRETKKKTSIILIINKLKKNYKNGKLNLYWGAIWYWILYEYATPKGGLNLYHKNANHSYRAILTLVIIIQLCYVLLFLVLFFNEAFQSKKDIESARVESNELEDKNPNDQIEK